MRSSGILSGVPALQDHCFSFEANCYYYYYYYCYYCYYCY